MFYNNDVYIIKLLYILINNNLIKAHHILYTLKCSFSFLKNIINYLNLQGFIIQFINIKNILFLFLKKQPNMINLYLLKAYLNLLNVDMKKYELIIYKKLDSTNDEAKRKVKENKLNNQIYFIVANIQYNGKGTHGKSWISLDYKNLYFSFILKLKNKINIPISYFSSHIAILITHHINNIFNLNLKIKYPNDIILNNGKVAGILTECIYFNNALKYIICGIGINLHQKKHHSLMNVNQEIYSLGQMKVYNDNALNINFFTANLFKFLIKKFINFVF